ncbi:MAG: hypothetical protein L0Z55_12405, partial [Planctomycetes bacterium]|nr:hypothetical protein [Planctomycetota bacterium]
AARQSDAAAELAVLAATRREEEEQLNQMERFPRETATCDAVEAALSRLSAPGIRQALEKYRETRARIFACDRTLADLLQDAAREEHKTIQRLRGSFKERAREAQRQGEERKREESRGDRIEAEIREYQKQEGRRAQLTEQNERLRREAVEKREEVEVRQLLVALLDESADAIRQRAGPSLGRCLKRLLPSLTGGRYNDLQVTADFRLRLFTSEKSDFLAQHELSGGTFEGLAFGFRLAFSQAFIRAVTHAPQFLFLDEPFRAMDAVRVHHTLLALLRLSPELAQIFVVLPGLRDGDRAAFDEIVRTAVGVRDFEHRFAGGGAEPEAAPLELAERLRAAAEPPPAEPPLAAGAAEEASEESAGAATSSAAADADDTRVGAADSTAAAPAGNDAAPVPRGKKFRPSVWFGASFVPAEPQEDERAGD